MSILRKLLAAVVSIGLVLSPIVIANAMTGAPIALADSTGSVKPPPIDQACTCCDLAGRCAARACASSCLQLGAPPDAALYVGNADHDAWGGIVLSLHAGLSWPPPAPPPRA